MVAVLGVLAFSSAPALAGQGYENVTSTFGGPCAGPGGKCEPGQFKEPTSIAVNDETEEVYVLDKGNDRVEWFNSTGSEFKGEFNGVAAGHPFLNPEGIAIDNSCASQKPALTGSECEAFDPSNGDVYVADQGHEVVDRFGATGKYEGQFIGGKCEPRPNPEEPEEAPPCAGSPSKKVVPFKGLLDVAVDPSGDVFVYEAEANFIGTQFGTVYEFSNNGGFMERFDALGGASTYPGFAVDSSGNVYVVKGNGQSYRAVYEFQKATGARLVSLTESAKPGSTLAIIASTNNLLLDEGASIELFKSPLSDFVSPLLTFPGTGLSESAGIAVNGAKGEGTIYATQRGDNDVDVFESGKPEAPEVVPGSESASSLEVEETPNKVEIAAVIDPENRTTTYSFEYSHEVKTNAQGEPVRNAEGELELAGTITTISGETTLPAEFGNQNVTSPKLTGITSPEPTIYYRVVAENEESNGTPTYGKVEAYTKLPLVENEKFSDLTSTSSKLEATINPVFLATAYSFEYAASKQLLEENKGTLVGAGATGEGGAPEPLSTEITDLEPGVTYYYRVIAENEVTQDTENANKGKPVHGEIEEVTPYAAPGVVTGEAQNITGTAATLSGEVDPEGTGATYHFAYVSEAGFKYAIAHGAANPEAGGAAYQKELAEGARSPYAEGETTTPIALPSSSTPQAVGPIPAADLLPGVTYHYALVAVNEFELQTVGPDRTFTTHAGRPPLVSTGGASNVSQNSATLSGTVTTNGLQTNYGFEISAEPNNYGPATGLGAIGGAATEEVHVTLGELQPGTTYYYRVTATNADGTKEGEPASFTTPGFPTLISPPASPAPFPFTKVAFPKEEKPSGTSTKALTNKQKLAKALKACGKKPKSKRAGCERLARRKYGAVKKRTRA
jgi:hypothetical protein